MADEYVQVTHWDNLGWISVPKRDVEFVLVRRLQSGNCSTVSVVHQRCSDELMVMKECKANSHHAKEREILAHLTDTGSPFIVKLLRCYTWRESLSFVMEYLPLGNLWDLMHARKVPHGVEAAKFYGAQMVLALQTLKSAKVVHRDIKLENILVAKNGYIKLCDFGFAKRFQREDQRTTTPCGTLEYMGPERYNRLCEYAFEVDMWALGVFLIELGFGKLLIKRNELADISAQFRGGAKLTADHLPVSLVEYCLHYPDKVLNNWRHKPYSVLRDLIIKLLHPTQAKRWTATQCTRHCFFTQDESFWEKLEAQSLEPPYKESCKRETCEEASHTTRKKQKV